MTELADLLQIVLIGIPHLLALAAAAWAIFAVAWLLFWVGIGLLWQQGDRHE